MSTPFNIKCVSPPEASRRYPIARAPKSEPGVLVQAAYDNIAGPMVYEAMKNYRRSDGAANAVIEDFKRGDVPYVKPPSRLEDRKAYELALTTVTELYRPPKPLRPVSYEDTKLYDWELSTSVESPFTDDPTAQEHVRRLFEAGLIPNQRMSKSNLFDYVYKSNQLIVEGIESGILTESHRIASPTTKAHARAHVVQENEPDKIRMVFGVPWLMIMIEVMLLWPLVNWMKKGATPIAWGFETMRGGMKKLVSILPSRCSYLCLDWSKFDKSTPYWLVDDIHLIWKSYMDFNHDALPNLMHPRTKIYCSSKFENLWRWMNMFVKNMKITLPDGSIYVKLYAGIASGLFQTQILDTFVNHIVILTVLTVMDFDITTIKAVLLGDDSVIAIPRLADSEAFLEEFASHARRIFGFELNQKKSIIAPNKESIHFLGYHNVYGTPVRSKVELLARFLKPERRWEDSHLKARALGLAYANCGVDLELHRTAHAAYLKLEDSPLDIIGSGYLSYLRSQHIIIKDSFPSRSYLLGKLDAHEIDFYSSDWPSDFLPEY